MAQSAYWLVRGKTRDHPLHGFTVESMLKKRWRECSSTAALTLYFIAPALQQAEVKVRQLSEEKDPEVDQLAPIMQEAAVHGAKNYGIVLSKTLIQASAAAVLIERNTPLTNSIVFHWDMYPRLHQKYVGDLLQMLRLPRFLAGALGPKTEAVDLSVQELDCSPTSAFQDSIKRHMLGVIATATVKGVLAAWNIAKADPKNPKRKPKAVAVKQALLDCATEFVTLLGNAVGAASGRAIAKSGAGEYWGEYVGQITISILWLKVLQAANSHSSAPAKPSSPAAASAKRTQK